jgi:hypothetical protein
MFGRRLVISLVSGLALAVIPPVAAFANGPTHPGRPIAPACDRHAISRITLTEADNGRRVCVRRGETITVMLRVSSLQSTDVAQRWSPIAASGPALRAQPHPLIAIRGVTMSRYRAVMRGHARLYSSRLACARWVHGPRCHTRQAWNATVIVL